MRVFCDFEFGKGRSYYVYNMKNPIGKDIGFSIKDYKDIRYQCAKIGLEPISVTGSPKQIENLRYYIKAVGYDLSKRYQIPLGYDYACNDGKCSRKYKQLDIDTGADVTGAYQTQLVFEA